MRKPLLAALSACALVGAFAPGVDAEITSKEDLLTGKTSHWKSVKSTTTVPNSIGRQKHATIFIRCLAGEKLKAYVRTPTYNADNDDVKLRWGEGGVVKEWWNESTNSQSLFSRRPKRFLQQLIENDRLVFAWEPYSKTEQAVAFDLVPEREDLKKMVELCGVTLKPDKRNGSTGTRRPGRDR